MSDTPTIDVIHDDALDALDDLTAESVHAVVTDPPYGLNFMGKDWDNFRRRDNEDDVGRDNVGGRLSATAPASGAETDMHKYQEWNESWARKAKRVLKPGGHLLAFSGNRTHHRLFAGVEDAGFEVRDTLTWHYGSGFPKAMDVGKVIDKRADAEREVVGEKRAGISSDSRDGDMIGGEAIEEEKHIPVTEPATDEAKRWDGWKTGLKPTTEFVVMARKPFDGATVDCVLENGTGALNIDGCRIPTEDSLAGGHHGDKPRASTYGDATGAFEAGSNPDVEPADGRYPANVAFDELAAADLDEVSGGHGDSGGPSRYFYTSKASRRERTHDGVVENPHPTVKPIDLMEHYVALVSRADQTVLDPFAGTGTTGLAAWNRSRDAILIEESDAHVETIHERIEANKTAEGSVGTDPQNRIADVGEW